jgi:hypothetical protein
MQFFDEVELPFRLMGLWDICDYKKNGDEYVSGVNPLCCFLLRLKCNSDARGHAVGLIIGA